MSKTYETGHAKNVANLQKLIEQVTVYTAYNPAIERLKLESLNTLYTNALAGLIAIEDKRNAKKNAIYQRQEAYQNLKPLTTRVINHLDILGLTSGTLEQAKTLNRLIQGGKKTSNDTEATKTASTSRQSYTQLADNFSKLVQLLATIASYVPNLDELKLLNLEAYLTTLVNSTKAIDQTEAEFNTARIERDNLLYAKNTGLYSTAQNVKKYVKSIYGATAPEYNNVKTIKFTESA